jgi:hypothetical protein
MLSIWRREATHSGHLAFGDVYLLRLGSVWAECTCLAMQWKLFVARVTTETNRVAANTNQASRYEKFRQITADNKHG